jgi:hypothetical protein
MSRAGVQKTWEAESDDRRHDRLHVPLDNNPGEIPSSPHEYFAGLILHRAARNGDANLFPYPGYDR